MPLNELRLIIQIVDIPGCAHLEDADKFANSSSPIIALLIEFFSKINLIRETIKFWFVETFDRCLDETSRGIA